MLPRLTRRFASFKQAKLPSLAFDLHELEPVLSKTAMDLHYNKHHQTYVNEYNKAVENFLNADAKGDASEQLKHADLIKFHLGGHFNHSFFWENLAPANKSGGVLPSTSSAFGKKVVETFGGFDKLIAQISQHGNTTQGSGWVWLTLKQDSKQLVICKTPNQETVSQKGLVPLLTIDLWEHAYYVNYQNKRAAFIDEIWKVVNWKKVEERFGQHSK